MNLIISPPFGNYITSPGVMSIKGSFTVYPRPGKWLQIFKTLRYSYTYSGWCNQIGLRNPGIDSAIKNYKKGNSIISIAVLEKEDIDIFKKKLPEDMDIEINISCPNTEHNMIRDGIHKLITEKRNWCIVKLSPLDNISSVDVLYNNGFRQFHCSNTLPTKNLQFCKYKGGLSGPMLIPYTTKLVKEIRKKYPDTTIIAGGGVQNIHTYNHYMNTGANYVSVSSILFTPWKYQKLYSDIYLKITKNSPPNTHRQ